MTNHLQNAGWTIRQTAIRLWQHHRTETVLTACTLLLYLFLIFEQITVFPAYFFCDEAIVGVEAYSILTTGKDQTGVWFPAFFKGLGEYQQSLAVYLQVPFVALFGLNEFAVRLTNACISLVGVGAIYLLIRFVFRLKSAWLTFAVFALSPVWFLHSRTGFECVMAVAFFMAFGLCYILAFTRHPKYIIPAAFCGAATFYAYTPGRGWILIALILLFLVNICDHLRHWKMTLIGLALFVVLLSPYIHFHFTHPGMALKRLESLYLYVPKPQNFSEQFQRMWQNYELGLSYRFWYTWEGSQEIESVERHVVPQLPQLMTATFPFMLLGVLYLLRHFRKLESRTILALLIATPFPSSLIHFNSLRGMPVGIIFLMLSILGIGWLFQWIQRWGKLTQWLQRMLLIGIIAYAVWFRSHVYTAAPYAYRDYGFYGLQMGAPEVFHWIRTAHYPYDHILISPDLFNAGDIFIPFYLKGEAARKTKLFDTHLIYKPWAAIPENAVFIAPVSFYADLQAKGYPIQKEVLRVIYDLRGKSLFEITRMTRSPDLQTWIQGEEQRRRELHTSTVSVKGVQLQIKHPEFDLGYPQAMFDGNVKSIARSAAINPAQVIIQLPTISLRSVIVTMTNQRAEISIKTRSNGNMTDWGTQRYSETVDHLATVTFERPTPLEGVTELDILMRATDSDQYGYVHIGEIVWE